MSEPNTNAIPSVRQRTQVKTLTSLAMLTAIAYVMMYLSKLLPQVSGFLQLDVKDTVICIGGFVFGPLAAAIISIVVAVVEMFTVSDTGPIRLHHECAGHRLLLLHCFLCVQENAYQAGRRRRSELGRGRPHRRDGAVELFDYAVVHDWLLPLGYRRYAGPHLPPL